MFASCFIDSPLFTCGIMFKALIYEESNTIRLVARFGCALQLFHLCLLQASIIYSPTVFIKRDTCCPKPKDTFLTKTTSTWLKIKNSTTITVLIIAVANGRVQRPCIIYGH